MFEKDQQIDNLLDRLQKVDDKFVDLGRDFKNFEKNQISEKVATTMKTCEKCEFKTLLKSDLEKNIVEKHVDVFKCEFCEFTANIEGELKTHLRRKHNNKINQFDWKLCEFCNFNCRGISEMGTHMKHTVEGISIITCNKFTKNFRKCQNKDNQCDYYSGKDPR